MGQPELERLVASLEGKLERPGENEGRLLFSAEVRVRLAELLDEPAGVVAA
jgi:hypothetical protein